MVMLYLMLLAAAPQADARKEPVDDWQAVSITEVARADSTAGPLYLKVHAGDLDGDGAADDAVLRISCTNGAVSESAYWLTGPRDAASGQATGKRMHKPVTFIKEWGAASPQLMKMKPTYDVKTMNGARMSAGDDGWTPIQLSTTDGMCAATTEAARATKTRSNIQNN
jgi:hypothetical protein